MKPDKRLRASLLFICLAVKLSLPNSSIASDPLSASQITWKEHFGTSGADTNTLFSLMAHGYFRAESTNVQPVMIAWLKDHPNAVVISVSSGGPLMTKPPSSKLVFVWVMQGSDSLNVKLVRQGCFLPDTQILNPGEKLEVSQKDYQTFVQRVVEAGKQAKKEKVGIWSELPKRRII